jgi:hypothetical protein
VTGAAALRRGESGPQLGLFAAVFGAEAEATSVRAATRAIARQVGMNERGLSELERRYDLWAEEFLSSEEGSDYCSTVMPDNWREMDEAEVDVTETTWEFDLWGMFVAHIRETEPDLLTAYWGTSAEARGAIYFASGTNEPGEIRALARAGQHLGVSAERLRPRSIAVLKALKGLDIQVFLDSGAYGEVAREWPFEVKRPISEQAWAKRLARAADLAQALRGQLYIVAPDRIADQATTLERFRAYATEVRALEAAGAHIIVPVPLSAVGPSLPRAEFWRRATEILGLKTPIAGIPSKKKAATVAELAEFAREARPARLHLLGLGPNAAAGHFHQVVEAVAAVSPRTRVFCDSVMLQGMRGNGRKGITGYKHELRGSHGRGNEYVTEEATVRAVMDRQAGGRSKLTVVSRAELAGGDPVVDLPGRAKKDPIAAAARGGLEGVTNTGAGEGAYNVRVVGAPTRAAAEAARRAEELPPSDEYADLLEAEDLPEPANEASRTRRRCPRARRRAGLAGVALPLFAEVVAAAA